MGGLLAAAGLAPAMFAKAGNPSSTSAVKAVSLRPEQRAVSRQEGSL